MSVESTENKIVFTGTGVITPFAFTFRLFETSDLVVTKYTIADGSEELLTESVDYLITWDPESPIGGHIHLVDDELEEVALSADYKLILQRILPITQELDYVENDPFPAETHEEGLDRLTMICQQIQDELDRSLKADATQSGVDYTLPGPEAGSLIGWDETGTGLKNYADQNDVTAAAVLNDFVTNYLATQAEAEAGTNNTKYMTPLRVRQAIDYKLVIESRSNDPTSPETGRIWLRSDL